MQRTQFLLGMIAAGAFYMAYQDWLGQAEYKRQIDLHWLDLHWSVGAALMVFAIVASTVCGAIKTRCPKCGNLHAED